MLILDFIPNAPQGPLDNTSVFLRDSEVNDYVINIITNYLHNKASNPDHTITHYIGQELIVLRFRVAVKEKLLSSKEIEIRFEGTTLEIDETGRLEDWPTGFCDVQEDLLNRFLGWD